MSQFAQLNAEVKSDLQKYISLAAIGRQLGRHRTTVWRWFRYGYRGVRLHAVRFPSGWATTIEAVQQFVEQLTAQAEPEQPLSRSFRRQERRQEVIEAELASRFGIGGKGKEGGPA